MAVAAKAIAADKPTSADQIQTALEGGIGKPPGKAGKGHGRTVHNSNRVWTVKELKDQFGEPSSRADSGSISSTGKDHEHWTWTMDDGTVHAGFRRRGYLHTDDPGSLRLEIVSTRIERTKSKPKSEAAAPEKVAAAPESGASQPAPAISSKAAVRTPAPEIPKQVLDCDTFKEKVIHEKGRLISKEDFYKEFGKPASLRDVAKQSSHYHGTTTNPGADIQQAISESQSSPSAILTYKLRDGVVEVSIKVNSRGGADYRGFWRVLDVRQVK